MRVPGAMCFSDYVARRIEEDDGILHGEEHQEDGDREYADASGNHREAALLSRHRMDLPSVFHKNRFRLSAEQYRLTN